MNILPFDIFIKESLKEYKQCLYHSTDNIKGILSRNILLDKTEHFIKDKNISGISLSRDKFFNYLKNYTLELNQEKLKRRYKIIPFDFFFRKEKRKLHPSRPTSSIESEEFLIGKITNLDKYIISIRINNFSLIRDIFNEYMVDDDMKTILFIKRYLLEHPHIKIYYVNTPYTSNTCYKDEIIDITDKIISYKS